MNKRQRYKYDLGRYYLLDLLVKGRIKNTITDKKISVINNMLMDKGIFLLVMNKPEPLYKHKTSNINEVNK